jgi:hypothetical protein
MSDITIICQQSYDLSLRYIPTTAEFTVDSQKQQNPREFLNREPQYSNYAQFRLHYNHAFDIPYCHGRYSHNG